MTFDTTTTVLAGVPRETLQAWLTAAQSAYMELMTGAKVASASYTQNDGSRAVTYTQTDVMKLIAFIRSLQVQLGLACPPRRPVYFNFR